MTINEEELYKYYRLRVKVGVRKGFIHELAQNYALPCFNHIALFTKGPFCDVCDIIFIPWILVDKYD